MPKAASQGGLGVTSLERDVNEKPTAQVSRCPCYHHSPPDPSKPWASYKAAWAVARHSAAPALSRALLFVLALHTNERLEARVLTSTLAEETGLSLRAVSYHLHALKALGEITARGQGPNAPWCYTLTLRVAIGRESVGEDETLAKDRDSAEDEPTLATDRDPLTREGSSADSRNSVARLATVRDQKEEDSKEKKPARISSSDVSRVTDEIQAAIKRGPSFDLSALSPMAAQVVKAKGGASLRGCQGRDLRTLVAGALQAASRG